MAVVWMNNSMCFMPVLTTRRNLYVFRAQSMFSQILKIVIIQLKMNYKKEDMCFIQERPVRLQD